jgi:hypothetical protein
VTSKLEDKEVDGVKNDESLRIAWRYSQQQQQKPSNQSEITSLNSKALQPNYFRTDKLMTKEEIFSQCNVKSFQPPFIESDETTTRGFIYSKLAHDLTTHIDNIELNVTKTKSYTNILRIVVNSIGSLIYNDQCSLNEDHATDLCKFLLYLR